MLTKYRFVKVRFAGVPDDFYAYERTFLGFFKSYLGLNPMFTQDWHGELTIDNTWLYRRDLLEVKKAVKVSLHKYQITITDAETKLERHLGGLE